MILPGCSSSPGIGRDNFRVTNNDVGYFCLFVFSLESLVKQQVTGSGILVILRAKSQRAHAQIFGVGGEIMYIGLRRHGRTKF